MLFPDSAKAEKVIDADDAQELRIKTKAQFIIYGRVRSRSVGGTDRYILELDGLVAHKPVEESVGRALAQEFTELLPRKVMVNREDDLLSFEFTSEWAQLVAKYIIGIAAAVSGDIQYAEDLYLDVREKLRNNKAQLPAYEKLRSRIPRRLAEIFEARARHAYEMWASTHDGSYIEVLGDALARHDTETEKNKALSALTLSAIHFFLSDRDTIKARNCLNQVPKPARDAVWHFNQAFLWAYQGDLKHATRHYKNGLDCPILPDLIAKVEDFLCAIAALETDKVQLHYCLGFLNWKVKGDVLRASKDFKTFIEAASDKDFEKEKELALQWVEELEAAHA